MRQSSKLNRLSLDVLSNSVEREQNEIALKKSESNSQTNKQRLVSAAVLNKSKSTFNQFYLPERYRDLLSIQTAGDTLKSQAPTKVCSEIFNLNLRESSTQAPTMIQRLQEETAEQNFMRETGRLPVFKSSQENS